MTSSPTLHVDDEEGIADKYVSMMYHHFPSVRMALESYVGDAHLEGRHICELSSFRHPIYHHTIANWFVDFASARRFPQATGPSIPRSTWLTIACLPSSDAFCTAFVSPGSHYACATWQQKLRW